MIEPTIGAPLHFLNSGLPPENAAAAVRDRTAAKMDQIRFAIFGLNEIAVSGPLELGIRDDRATSGCRFAGAARMGLQFCASEPM